MAEKINPIEVRNHIRQDKKSGVLQCEEDKNYCIFQVVNDKITVGDIKKRYDIADGKLTEGDIGQKNRFGLFREKTSMDSKTPRELRSMLSNFFTGNYVYIPKSEIDEYK